MPAASPFYLRCRRALARCLLLLARLVLGRSRPPQRNPLQAGDQNDEEDQGTAPHVQEDHGSTIAGHDPLRARWLHDLVHFKSVAGASTANGDEVAARPEGREIPAPPVPSDNGSPVFPRVFSRDLPARFTHLPNRPA